MWIHHEFTSMEDAMNFHRSIDRNLFECTPPYLEGNTNVWIVAYRRKEDASKKT
jgi:hypothetical protein